MVEKIDRTTTLKRDLGFQIKARYPFIWLVTQEDIRVLKIIQEISREVTRKAYIFDQNQLWTTIDAWLNTEVENEEKLPPLLNAKQIQEAFASNIQDVAEQDYNYILIFPDMHFYLQQGDTDLAKMLIRYIKWLEPKLRSSKCTVVFLSNNGNIPNEVADIISVEVIRPPEKDELSKVLDEIVFPTNIQISTEIKEMCVNSALGLTLNQAKRLFSLSLVTKNKNQSEMIDVIVKGKKNIIASSGSLEFFAPNEVPQYLAGLDTLKEWLSLRKNAFSKEAEKFRLPRPKGVFLMGIPGTGKSLTAKFIAGTWRMPLLRFDLGALYGSYVGQTEAAVRQALHIVEAIAPAILWIDEIEKSVSPGANLDSGVSNRLFGSLLTWMQEKSAPVFLIATANDITHLPAELMRKGRFDEIFFLDLPTPVERKAIFEVHIANVGRTPSDYDIDTFVEKTHEFVGAEIEQIIKEALYLAFADKQREMEDRDILTAIERTMPLSRTKSELINSLRSKVENKEVVLANSKIERKGDGKKGIKLELQ